MTAPCEDAQGRFINCADAKPKATKCRLNGEFAKCSMSRHEAGLTPECECFAQAPTLVRIHGNTAAAFIAERVEAPALAGDDAGVQR